MWRRSSSISTFLLNWCRGRRGWGCLPAVVGTNTLNTCLNINCRVSVCFFFLRRAQLSWTAALTEGALSGSLWTAATWTAPETRTQELPSAPQPANPPSLCPTQMTGMICSVIIVYGILFLYPQVFYSKAYPFSMMLIFGPLCILQRQPS